MGKRLLGLAAGIAAVVFLLRRRGRLHRLWRGMLAADEAIAADFANLRDLFTRRIPDWIGAQPELQRRFFDGLRRHKPVFVVPGFAVVTTYDDVREVLQNPVFSVEPVYAEKMRKTSGEFILGMDSDRPQYGRESAILRRAVRPGDLDTIRGIIAEEVDAIVAGAMPRGQLDVIGEFGRVVPARVVARYFGVPGPDEATLQRWLRTIFHEIFINLANDPEVAAAADASAREMLPYLDGLIAERKSALAAGGGVPDDYLGHLLEMQRDPETFLDDAAIRRGLGGIVVGAVDTTSKAVAHALDQLLLRPRALRDAQEAARAGDDATLSAIVFEALRFNPQNPFLLRTARAGYTVARGTKRAAMIPAGTLVCAATLAAMFDPAVFDRPDAFRADRPAGNYLHFGHGPHTCFGEQINRIQVPRILGSLLRLPNLRRAPGDDGRIAYAGPFPDRLIVLFDPLST
jgi:cytochrome P450